MRDKFLSHNDVIPSDFLLPIMCGIRLRPVTADYAAGTLHYCKIKYDLMFLDSNSGLALWTVHTYLRVIKLADQTAAQYSLASEP